MEKESFATKPRWCIMKKFAGKNGAFFAGVLCCFLIILIHAYSAGRHADFFPTNGTFQDYNPVRRMLDGQIPYKDFQDYLGLGHLFLGSLATLLFGGTYRSSLVAFSFLSLAGLASITFAAAKAVFRKKESAIALTNIVLVFLIVKPVPVLSGAVGGEIQAALDYALRNANSARFVRGLILPISCGLLWFGKKAVSYWFSNKGTVPYTLMVGIVAGFSFLWSNDYGISCWLCILIMTFWCYFTADRSLLHALKYVGLAVITSICAIIVFASVFTFGHLGSWLQATFGTGSYQSWYYNSEKSYYLWDVDFFFPVIVQAFLCLYYLISMIPKHKSQISRKKNATLAYINMVGFCATQEYKLLSGGNSREVALSILFVTVLFEGLSFLLQAIDYRRTMTAVSFVLSIFLVVSAASALVFNHAPYNDSVYIEEMGGNLTWLGDDLIKTDQFLSGEHFFSTYSSAQEVVSGIFQPSGTDYIIHVLGDDQREKYLDAFHSGDFRYTATISEKYSPWEHWIQRANWFFYREVYKNWHPVFANAYEIYWERNTSEDQHVVQDGFSLNVSFVGDSQAKISIQCDSNVNGTADVYIDYAVKSRGNLSSYLNILKLLNIEPEGLIPSEDISPFFLTHNLRDVSAEYIPVSISNGYGEVILSANPARSAYLEINSCSCDAIYTVTSDYLEISRIQDKNTLCISACEKNSNSVSGITGVVYDGVYFPVESVTQDNNTICIRVSGNIQETNRNMVKLVR